MRKPITLVVALVFSMLFASAHCVWAVPLTGNTGPGGFEATDASSDLRLWLRGDVGVVGGPVTQWTDQSFFGNDAVPDAVGNQPAVSTLNGRPAVGFTGTGDVTTNDRLEFPTVAAQTIVVTNRLATGNPSLAGIIGRPTDFGIRRTSSTTWQDPGNSGDYTNPGGSQFLVNGGATSLVNENVNHILTAIRAGGTTGISSLGDYFDHVTFGASRFFNGDIGEVVIYNRELNVAERTVLENNQSAKYGITISNDRYTGDTSFGYDRDVFGIGQDASDSLTLGNAGSGGLGFEDTGSSLLDDDYLLAGHKVQSNALTSFGVPAGEALRMQRVWYVDRTNAAGLAVDMAFDFSDAGINVNEILSASLLFSTTDSPFGFSPVGGLTTSILGDTVTFGVPAGTLLDGFYTVAITVPVPEPSSFLLLGLGALGLVRHTRRRRWRA